MGEGRAAVLWLSSNDGAQGGDFAYAKELRGAMIELIVQPASTSVESGLDLLTASTCNDAAAETQIEKNLRARNTEGQLLT